MFTDHGNAGCNFYYGSSFVSRLLLLNSTIPTRASALAASSDSLQGGQSEIRLF